MSLLIDDTSLLENLISIGAKEEERKLKREAQDAKKEDEEKKAKEEEAKSSSNAREFFLNSLNLLKNDQISNNVGKDISIEIQSSVDDLIKYLANNVITIGNEVIVTTFPVENIDKYKPLTKDKRYMISQNCAIRVDLLRKYLSKIRNRFQGRPAAVKVSELIEKTENYIRNPDPSNNMFGGDTKFSVEKSKDDKLFNDDTVLDSTITKAISEDTVPMVTGKTMICVGDLKDDASLTSWIIKNKNILVFIDDNEKDPQKRELTWDGDPHQTQKMKSILVNFLQKRSRSLLERSGQNERALYDKYVKCADSLASSMPAINENQQNQRTQQNQGQQNQEQYTEQFSRDFVNTLISTLPFDPKENGNIFRYQVGEAIADQMGSYLGKTRYNTNIQALSSDIKEYASMYGNISELNINNNYNNIRGSIEHATGGREKRIERYLAVLSDIMNSTKAYLSDMSMYVRSGALKIDMTLRSAAASQIEQQKQYCDRFIDQIRAWGQDSSYDLRR